MTTSAAAGGGDVAGDAGATNAPAGRADVVDAAPDPAAPGGWPAGAVGGDAVGGAEGARGLAGGATPGPAGGGGAGADGVWPSLKARADVSRATSRNTRPLTRRGRDVSMRQTRLSDL